MSRFFGVALVVLALPACAISPPASVFSSLNSYDDGARSSSPAPQTEKKVQQAGLGSTISGWWDSVKSGFDTGSNDKVAPADPTTPAFDPATAQKLVNAYRAQKGLKPLKLSAKLNEAARVHSSDLAKSDRISHYGSDGSDAWERVRKTGYGPRLTAENVGTGQKSLDEVFRGWQKSPDHNANLLLRDADEMGVAMVYNPGSQFKTFWTMVVASPRVNSAAR